MNNLMIVAHPDDELIFGGAKLLDGNDWTIFCLTNGNTPRAEYFNKIHNEMHNHCIITNHIDINEPQEIHPQSLELLEGLIIGHSWDEIVTHSLEGEYGHHQHIALAKCVSGICHLLNKQLFTFSFDINEPISEELLKQKRYWLNQYNDGVRNFNISTRYDNWIYCEKIV